jgi:non-ribosomal peptide synthetase component F
MENSFRVELCESQDESQYPLRHVITATTKEQLQILVGWNNTVTDYQCIHEWFEEQTQQTPDHIAVVFGHEQLTYQQLNQRAKQQAHHLQATTATSISRHFPRIS